MRQVIAILKNDLRRRLRSPLAIVLMMMIPLVLTLIIGLVFGRSGEVGLPSIRVLLVDNDEGFFSNFLTQGLRQDRLGEMITLDEVEQDEGIGLMERGKASAMLIIPDGFTEDILEDRPAKLFLIKNPAEAFLPLIVEEAVETNALVLDGAVRIFNEPIGHLQSLLEGEGWPTGTDLQRLLDQAHDRLILVQGYLTDSLITYRTVQLTDEGGEEDGGFNLFAWILPGSLMIGLLFISEIVMRDLVREKDTGTLARIFTAPVEAEHVVSAKVLATFIITGAACVLLLLIGRVAFGIDLGKPLPLVVHLVATILMCTGLITFFYGFIRSERAADAVLSIVIIVLSLLGGSMVPYEQMGREMRQVARFSPVHWAIDGFKQIMIYDGGMGEILPNLVVLFAIALAAMIPGIALLRHRVRGGG